jgi:curli biogenesis system outer membrane secretion channel CsgG
MKRTPLIFKTTLFCVAISLTACIDQSINTGVEDAGPKVMFAPIPSMERMNVAIGRFTNESVYGSGLFTDQSGDRIGKQAADIFMRHLMATQRFNVMERQDIGKLKDEAVLMGESDKEFKHNLKSLDAMVIGSVAELGRETTGGTWLIGAEKTQRARARVVIRLVDPKTGEAFFSQEGSGEATMSANSTLGFGGQAGFDSTLEGKAIDAAIVHMINNIVTTLDSRKKHF